MFPTQLPERCVWPLAQLLGQGSLALCGAAADADISNSLLREQRLQQDTAEQREHVGTSGSIATGEMEEGGKSTAGGGREP